jgi:hypothetical protein
MTKINQNALQNVEPQVLSLEEQIKQSEIALKALKAKQKEEKVKKGQKVRFTTKQGQVIEGHGVLYYYVIVNNKPYMKQADQVTLIKEEEKA